jgi:low temperature requirement protein LtrA
MRQFVVPLKLRATGESGRKVTWLELFFDLIFVAAVAQVAEPLRHDYSLAELVRFTPLLVLIWWAWTGHSVFSTRFDTDDVVQRLLTLVQMFVVAAMAANAKDALDSRSSAGFAAAYAGVRVVLVAQYFRARHVPGARPLTTRYVAGHGIAAVFWLISALVPAPERFWIWAVALAIDLGTPWLAIPHSVHVPPDAAHLPERFGLFTLILLGESIVAVMQGMESQNDWTPAAATCAFCGMTVSFLIWWWYFDGARAASEQPIRSRRDALRFHIWSYAHFPFYLGIIVTGVGVQRVVSAASLQSIDRADVEVLIAALCTVMAALTAIGSTSAGRSHAFGSIAGRHSAVTAMTFVAGHVLPLASAPAVVVLVTACCISQLAISLSAGEIHPAPATVVQRPSLV